MNVGIDQAKNTTSNKNVKEYFVYSNEHNTNERI